ncbi:variant erythrocyte surface antigen-1, beta subunit [Babesia caballi]|uniref:Variant erythrocyte surface antigen-1, beta subunit n=1 Tax=Babesia caballi TaxID=5871 RepID=A0AAV4LZF7_BABCB|nr:variant erythrocyte surface antigen-1, beta subunit [Babesia caballi]
MTGATIISSAMNKNFTDFEEGMTKAQQLASERSGKENKAKQEIYSDYSESPNTKATYLEFLAGCTEKLNVQMKSGSATKLDECPLSALHLLASCYFRCLQSTLSAKSSIPPSTIREMLYFLAALPYSPNYDSLNSHFKSF